MRLNANEKRAHAFAIKAIRELGRELQLGTWGGRDAKPIAAPRVGWILGSALAQALAIGIESLRDAFDDKLDELLR